MAIPTTYPAPAPPLSVAFQVPTADQVNLNPVFWQDYQKAQTQVPAVCPSASNIPDWPTYHSMCINATLPNTSMGIVNTANIAFNEALFDASDWEWMYNPNSGHNKAF